MTFLSRLLRHDLHSASRVQILAMTTNPHFGYQFAQRAPSVNWEIVPFPECPQCHIAVWFKPMNVPNGVIISIPEQTWAVYPFMIGRLFTMRQLIQAVGIEPAYVSSWHLCGAGHYGMGGTNPLLDQPIPRARPGSDPNIIVDVAPPQAVMPQFVPAIPTTAAPAPPLPTAAGGPVSAEATSIFESIEKDWAACKEALKELTRLRKQLVDISSRLKNLNRDLSSDERLFSSPQDKKDWLDARRWLRDGMIKTMMLVKSHDIGDISDAGRGKHIEELYTRFIRTRTPFDGMESALQQFVEYRKMVTTLQSKMNSAYSQSGVTAERRAQAVLKRIQAKARKGKSRKNFMDVISDG